MIDLNAKVDFNKEPFDKQRGHAIYTLSDQGLQDYTSKNHFSHNYLNKYPKEILGMFEPYSEELKKIAALDNPYHVKESLPEPKINAKPIKFKEATSHNDPVQSQEQLPKQIQKQQPKAKTITQPISESKKQPKPKTITQPISEPKKPSNAFNIFSQSILNCVNRPGNELYQTDSYKKEMMKFKQQNGSRYQTKISSIK